MTVSDDSDIEFIGEFKLPTSTETGEQSSSGLNKIKNEQQQQQSANENDNKTK